MPSSSFRRRFVGFVDVGLFGVGLLGVGLLGVGLLGVGLAGDGLFGVGLAGVGRVGVGLLGVGADNNLQLAPSWTTLQFLYASLWYFSQPAINFSISVSA